MRLNQNKLDIELHHVAVAGWQEAGASPIED